MLRASSQSIGSNSFDASGIPNPSFYLDYPEQTGGGKMQAICSPVDNSGDKELPGSNAYVYA